MMILVDAGNSRVKWAWCEHGAIQPGEAFPTDDRVLPNQLQERWAGLARPEAVYLSNVAGADWERACREWVQAAWNAEIRVVRAEARCCGIVSGYEKPETLGVDRWVGMIGARASVGLPFCLIDCGTAITADLVDEQGRHCGGLIAPGLRLMREALLHRAPGVAAAGAVRGSFWGRTTAEGLESGTREMAAGLIERVHGEAQRTVGTEPTLVLTGGDAEAVAGHLRIPRRLLADVVLRGLAEIARLGSEESSAAARAARPA